MSLNNTTEMTLDLLTLWIYDLSSHEFLTSFIMPGMYSLLWSEPQFNQKVVD